MGLISMIINGLEESEHYSPRFRGSRNYVNGVKMTRCFEVDTVRGVASCYAMNENAKPFIKDGESEPATIQYFGKITHLPAPIGIKKLLIKALKALI